MCKIATKAYDNIYYQARLKASQFNSKYTSRQGAAEDLQINPTTLSNYELENAPVPHDIILKMSKIYDSPELLNQFCAKYCLIGKNTKEKIEIKDIALIALQISDKLEDINDKKRKLIALAADGFVDENEEAILIEIAEYFTKIKQTINELDLWIRRNNIDKKRAHKNMDHLKNLMLV